MFLSHGILEDPGDLAVGIRGGGGGGGHCIIAYACAHSSIVLPSSCLRACVGAALCTMQDELVNVTELRNMKTNPAHREEM